MQRIDGADVVGVLPAATAVVAPGYFTEGDPGAAIPATVVTGEWLNSVQEELAAVIVMDGAALSKASYTQLRDVLIHLLALRSDPASIATSPTRTRANLCTAGSTASGQRSTNVASNACTASGASTCNAASESSTAVAIASGNLGTSGCITGVNGSKNVNACVASTDGRARGNNAAVVASDGLSESTGNSSCVMASGDSNGADACLASGNKSAIVACDRSQVTGGGSAAVACFNSVVGGVNSAAVASAAADVPGSDSAVVACQPDAANVLPQAAGQASFVAASLGGRAIDATGKSAVLGSEDSIANAESAIVVASEGIENATAYSIGGGRTAGALGAATGANRNMTWRMESIGGNLFIDGSNNAGAADYAEAFENDKAGVLPVGTLIARAPGRKVRAASAGDRLLGVVSARPAMIGNAAPLDWAGRWQTDEFGRRMTDPVEMVNWRPLFEDRVRLCDADGVELYDGLLANEPAPPVPPEPVDGEEAVIRLHHRREYKVQIRDGWKGAVTDAPTPIPADARRFVVEVPREVAGYDASLPYVPRTQRPDAWTVVSLLGQVPVRVAKSVKEGDFLAAGKGGVGDAAETPGHGARVEVMEITQPFDKALGYAIAWCLVR